MSQKQSWLPSAAAVSSETIAVLAGTVLAALIMSQFPSVKDWVKKQLA